MCTYDMSKPHQSLYDWTRSRSPNQQILRHPMKVSPVYHLLTIVLSVNISLPAQEMRDLSRAAGIQYGSPVYALHDPAHVQLFTDQMGVATIMAYWKYSTHNQEGTYTWSEMDASVALAEQMNAEMHGHPLVWGSDPHIPDWVLAKPLDQGEAIMLDHIEHVAGRHAGKIDVWDVVNEAIEDDGTYRDSYWNRSMTGEYIIKAFDKAHQADPNADLIYNDYGMETNLSKFDAIKNLLAWLQSEDVGLTGLGWQLHVYVDDVIDSNFPLASRMEEISGMGLENYITELDIRIPDHSAFQQGRQKEAYKKIMQIFLSNSTKGADFQTWGLSDKYTWWNDFDTTMTHYPLPFDMDYAKKPAYWGLLEALTEHLGSDVQPGSYRLRNVGNDLFLTQSADYEGAPVIAHALDSDWTSQKWEVTSGPDQTFRLRCQWREWYLNVGAIDPGTDAVVYGLNNDWWSMMWFLEPTGNGFFRIKNRWSNSYLGSTPTNGVHIEAQNSSNTQWWSLETLDGDCLPNYTLSSPVSTGTQLMIQTSDWIVAESSIEATSNVDLQAATHISLSEGFEAHLGSTVTLEIQSCHSGGGGSSSLANPNANAHAQGVFQFLRTYQDDPDQCLILGQNLGWSFEKYDETVQALWTQTGQWPGIIGGQMRWAPGEIDYPVLVNLYSDWQAQGGIVELSMLPDNPWTGGDSWDRSQTDIWKLTTPGQDGYDAWRTQLDFYASILQDMQDAGVTVLWRPLMEMNGDWFWYGYTGDTDPQPYIDLYRQMFDYFTSSWGLNNLIWIYSANMAYSGIPAVDHYYPGDDVVDITGLDVYQNNLVLPNSQYQTMINLGKPFAITEFGPDHNHMDGSHDYLAFINKIRSDFPETIYAHAWHDWPDHLVTWINNQNYQAALNLSCVVSRDELGP